MRRVLNDDATLRFNKGQWLTKDQIQSYFSRLFAKEKNKKTEENSSKSKKKRKVTDQEPTVDELYDGMQELAYREHALELRDIQTNAQAIEDESHPVIHGGIDICELSKSIETSKTLSASLLKDHWDPKKIRKLIEVDMKLTYPGTRVSKPKAAKIIVDFVRKLHEEAPEEIACPHYVL